MGASLPQRGHGHVGRVPNRGIYSSPMNTHTAIANPATAASAAARASQSRQKGGSDVLMFLPPPAIRRATTRLVAFPNTEPRLYRIYLCISTAFLGRTPSARCVCRNLRIQLDWVGEAWRHVASPMICTDHQIPAVQFIVEYPPSVGMVNR